MERRVPAVIRGMEWAQEIATTCAAHGKAVEWRLPTGFRVKNDYRKPRFKTVQTWMGDRYAVNTLASPAQELDKRRCAQTIMANLTHSCDAAILHRSIELAGSRFGIVDFNMIHDSFGTHAVDVGALKECLASSIIDMLGTTPLLTQLRQHMLSFLPVGVDLPEPPIVGDFDPNLIRTSTYFAT